jgi:hypothetical protein
MKRPDAGNIEASIPVKAVIGETENNRYPRLLQSSIAAIIVELRVGSTPIVWAVALTATLIRNVTRSLISAIRI